MHCCSADEAHVYEGGVQYLKCAAAAELKFLTPTTSTPFGPVLYACGDLATLCRDITCACAVAGGSRRVLCCCIGDQVQLVSTPGANPKP